jgi:hypothetical protein
MTFTPIYLQSVLNVGIDQAPVFLVWTGVGATLGDLLDGARAERAGRRQAFAVFFVGIGGLSALLGFFSRFGAWYADLFPTSVRSTAAGFCFNFDRVGAIAGIKLVPILIPILGSTLTYCMASATYLCAAALVFTLRETKGAQLTSGN